MGLFNLFKKKPSITIQIVDESENKPYVEPKDLRTNKCPYCSATLKKVPGRKTKCPECQQFMFVRTRPQDNARVVVTEEQAEQIEEDWAIENGTHEEYLREKNRYASKKKELSDRFGSEASDNDVQWGLWNEDIMEHSKNGDWGMYRNTKLAMADQIRKEGRTEHAIRMLLEVCYYDANGPTNGGNRHAASNTNPGFDPENDGMIIPGIVETVYKLAQDEQMPLESLKEEYINFNQKFFKALKLPLSPEEAWDDLEIVLRKQSDV